MVISIFNLVSGASTQTTESELLTLQINVREYRNVQSKKDNPERLAR